MLQGLRMHIKTMEAIDITVDTQIIAAKEDAVGKAVEIGKAAVEAVLTWI